MPWQPSQRRGIQLRRNQCGPSAGARLHLDSSLCESQACSLHCPDSYLRNWLWVGEMRYRGAAAELPATHSNWDLGADHLVRCQEGLKLRLVRLTSPQQPNAASSEHYLKIPQWLDWDQRTSCLRREEWAATVRAVLIRKFPTPVIPIRKYTTAKEKKLLRTSIERWSQKWTKTCAQPKKQKHRFSDNTFSNQRRNQQQQQIPGQHLPGPIKCRN